MKNDFYYKRLYMYKLLNKKRNHLLFNVLALSSTDSYSMSSNSGNDTRTLS